jgi:hypothetical protein
MVRKSLKDKVVLFACEWPRIFGYCCERNLFFGDEGL